jgi:hypothetical protein
MSRGRFRYRINCESCLCLDVRQLHREGRFLTLQSFPMAWSIGDKPCGSIQVQTGAEGAILRFQCKDRESSEWKLVEQNVPITWTGCALGGRRPWFVCNSETNSGTPCGHRAAKIYLGAYPVFACRCCQRLAYASQKQGPHLRLIGKVMKIRMRLGGSPNLFEPFPDRPKGLHRKTYERLRKIHDAADRKLGA